MNETIKVNGEGRQLPVKYVQKRFAEGYGDAEQMGETITSAGPSAMVRHSYAQNRGEPAVTPLEQTSPKAANPGK